MPVPETDFNCMLPWRGVDARATPVELLSVEALEEQVQILASLSVQSSRNPALKIQQLQRRTFAEYECRWPLRSLNEVA